MPPVAVPEVPPRKTPRQSSPLSPPPPQQNSHTSSTTSPSPPSKPSPAPRPQTPLTPSSSSTNPIHPSPNLPLQLNPHLRPPLTAPPSSPTSRPPSQSSAKSTTSHRLLRHLQLPIKTTRQNLSPLTSLLHLFPPAPPNSLYLSYSNIMLPYIMLLFMSVFMCLCMCILLPGYQVYYYYYYSNIILTISSLELSPIVPSLFLT